MVRLLPFALALLLLGLLPTVARAGDESPNRFFEVYDKNGDGVVTPEELGADADVFRLLDKDADGKITPEDLGSKAPPRRPPDAPPGPNGRGPGAGGLGGRGDGPGGAGPGRGGRPGFDLKARLLRMDANGDGKVSREEFKGPAELFGHLDRNGDEVIDGTEMDVAPRGRGGPGGPGRGGPGQGGPGQGRPGQGGPGQGGPGGGQTPARMLEMWKKRIEAMDVDGDGKVTPDEYQGRMPFERLDANGDGVLDAKDLEAMKARMGGAGRRPDRPSPEQMREAFRKMDANGDGKITKDEYTGPIPFERLDRDGDGVLTPADMGQGPRGRDGRPGRGGRGGDRGAQGIWEHLSRLDRDGDGKITAEEFPGNARRFERLDKNGDGVLTPADFGDAPKKGPDTKGSKAVSVANLDQDGNGKLSRNEFPGTDDEWRDLDKNHDGWVTIDECAAK